MALNLDASPGVDGFGVMVYAVTRAHPKPQPIRSGSLQVLMYDGIVSADAVAAEQRMPRRVWTFTSAELKALQTGSAIGTGYKLTLDWGEDAPASEGISIIARYRFLAGNLIDSAPSYIAVPVK